MRMTSRRSLAARCVAVIGTVVLGVGLAGGAASARTAAVTPAAPCAGAATHPTYAHVVVVFMENKSFSQIIGSTAAPYINGLAKKCGLASQYHGVTYPSLPNYLAATGGSSFGVADDNGPASHPISAPSIFSQTGSGWASLSESMPSNCFAGNAYPYMVKHNPAPYFTNVKAACAKQNIKLSSSPSFAARYTFVTPNMLNDMHDGSITLGDNWLKTFVPKVVNSAQYQAGNTILLIVWDTDNRNQANRAPALVIAPQVKPGTISSVTFNHYSLLRLSEDALGLPRLANAATATSMRAAFHL